MEHDSNTFLKNGDKQIPPQGQESPCPEEFIIFSKTQKKVLGYSALGSCSQLIRLKNGRVMFYSEIVLNHRVIGHVAKGHEVCDFRRLGTFQNSGD